MKIGIIGDGGHSKKIQSILKKKKFKFFIYKPNKPNYFDDVEFNRLKKCNVIFIITPNSSHYTYIKKLYNNSYIFCEKPPVNNKIQFSKLKKIKSNKIYFNYNFRFLQISKILNDRNKYNLGKLVYANLIASHGLAKKEDYKLSWRSNIKKCPKGIFEIVSIHYLDLINYFFNIINIENTKLLNLSKVGNGYDTSLTVLKVENNALVNIFTTYNSAYSKNFCFLFENGIIEQKNNNIKIYGPALNFDKKGFFKSPKIIKKISINSNKDVANSLSDSIDYFIKHARTKKIFNKNNWKTSIESNYLIL